LAAALKQALDAKVAGKKVRQYVANRVTEVPTNQEFKRLWNNFTVTDPDVVFGDLCLFLPGELQALLDLAGDTDQVTLDQVMEAWDIAEQRAPDGMEYLRGITYWAAIGDHFYQIQAMSLQAKAMEEYFTWLLRDQTKAIGGSQYVELQATFDREQLADDDLSSIEVGGFIPETIHAEEIASTSATIEEEHKQSLGERIAHSFTKARQILEDLLGEVEASKIISSIPPDASLEVKVNIGYRATRRKLNKEFMNNIEAGLRNMPDGEIKVRGKSGEVKGDDARLAQEMNIKRHGDQSSLLDLEDTLEQILEVHRRFLHDGRIDQ
jgi:hypothetical protein